MHATSSSNATVTDGASPSSSSTVTNRRSPVRSATVQWWLPNPSGVYSIVVVSKPQPSSSAACEMFVLDAPGSALHVMNLGTVAPEERADFADVPKSDVSMR